LVAPDSPPALGTAYATADVHEHELLDGAVDYLRNGPFQARVEALHLRVTNITGGAKTLSVKVCLDAAGDFTLVPDTELPLDPGLTTADSACAALKVQIPIFAIFGGSKVFVFAHLDAGTADFAQSCVTWSET
jgi:hypothetical protein